MFGRPGAQNRVTPEDWNRRVDEIEKRKLIAALSQSTELGGIEERS